MAPVRSEGCCVRPSKPPNPSFSGSFSFPLFLLRWVVSSSEGNGHVWVSSWELLGTTGELRPGSGVGIFQVVLQNDIATLAGMHRHGAREQSKHGWVCVCVFAHQSAAALSAYFRVRGKGDSQRSPAAFRKTLSQSIIWLCGLLGDSTVHRAFKFSPVLIQRLGQPVDVASPNVILWTALKEQTKRMALSVAQGIVNPAYLMSPCSHSLATTTHISTC